MKRSTKQADDIEFLQTSSGELTLIIKGRCVDASQRKLAVMNALRPYGHGNTCDGPSERSTLMAVLHHQCGSEVGGTRSAQ